MRTPDHAIDPPLPIVPNIRALITESLADRWRVRCEDGKELTVDLGDVDYQRRNLPLMLVEAIVEFNLVDGDMAANVEVVEK